MGQICTMLYHTNNSYFLFLWMFQIAKSRVFFALLFYILLAEIIYFCVGQNPINLLFHKHDFQHPESLHKISFLNRRACSSKCITKERFTKGQEIRVFDKHLFVLHLQTYTNELLISLGRKEQTWVQLLDAWFMGNPWYGIKYK